MEEDLEYRIKVCRERIMGKTLSKKYPIKFSEGHIIQQEKLSGFDNIKAPLRVLGKLMVPYTGDKLIRELVKLEGEINSENRVGFYFVGGAILIAKYVLLGHLAYTLYSSGILDKVF